MNHEAVVAYIENVIRFFTEYSLHLFRQPSRSSENLTHYTYGLVLEVAKENATRSLAKLKITQKNTPAIVKLFSFTDLLPGFVLKFFSIIYNLFTRQKNSVQLQPTVQELEDQADKEKQLETAVLKTTEYLLRANEMLENNVAATVDLLSTCHSLVDESKRLIPDIVQQKSWFTPQLQSAWLYASIDLTGERLDIQQNARTAELELNSILGILNKQSIKEPLDTIRTTTKILQTNSLFYQYLNSINNSLQTFKEQMTYKPNTENDIRRTINATLIR